MNTKQFPQRIVIKPSTASTKNGFTLIELAIVLVIIGLIVGAVLVGRDLIKSSEIRSQISQLEKYRSAINAFKLKFNGMPGDINAGAAASFGLTPRTGTQGNGDGNGILETMTYSYAGLPSGLGQGNGEKTLFYIDLTTANGGKVSLIDGSFARVDSGGADLLTPEQMAEFMPSAKIGIGHVSIVSENSINYFILSRVVIVSSIGPVRAYPSLTGYAASSIDSKIDDGYPQTGSVIAKYEGGDTNYTALIWAKAGGILDFPNLGANPGAAEAAAADTCYDNGGVAGKAMTYTLGTVTNRGSQQNCALLAFRF